MGEKNQSCISRSRTDDKQQTALFTVLPHPRLAEHPYPQVYPSGHEEPKRDLDIVC